VSVEEAGLKSDRIDFRQEDSDTVSTRCFSLWQIEPRLQPFFLATGPSGNGLGSFGSSNDGRDGNGDNIFCGVENVDRRAWIVNGLTRNSERLEIFESNFHDSDFLQRK
jgi:hypothetical protein